MKQLIDNIVTSHSSTRLVSGLGAALSIGLMALPAQACEDWNDKMSFESRDQNKTDGQCTRNRPNAFKQGVNGINWRWQVRKVFPQLSQRCPITAQKGCDVTIDGSPGSVNIVSRAITVVNPIDGNTTLNRNYHGSNSWIKTPIFKATVHLNPGQSVHPTMISLRTSVDATKGDGVFRGAWTPTGETSTRGDWWNGYYTTYRKRWKDDTEIARWGGEEYRSLQILYCKVPTQLLSNKPQDLKCTNFPAVPQ